MIKPLGSWTYDPTDHLGRGGYAEVFACQGRVADGPLIQGALKIFKDSYYANTLEREVAALEVMRDCPQTPMLLDHGRDIEGHLCIVTTLAKGQILEKVLRDHGPLSLEATYSLLRQILPILACAHAGGWLHKDLKASNLLQDGDCFTLLDWGIAEPVGDGRAEIIRSKNQDAVAPEAYFGRHCIGSDFYQLGLLACHALTGVPPYHLADEHNRDYRVAAHCMERPQLPAITDSRLQALLGNWLDKDPKRRIIAYDLDTLLALAPQHPPDFSQTNDYRQLSREGYLLSAARAGVPYAMYEWGVRLHKQSRTDEAIFWLEKSLALDYGRAALQLAEWLDTDSNLRDEKRIGALLEMAAAAGVAKAQYRLAEIIRVARGGMTRESESLLRQAAERGYRKAQYRLARELAKTKVFSKESRRWLEQAADRGHESARIRLAEQVKNADKSTLGQHESSVHTEKQPILLLLNELERFTGGKWQHLPSDGITITGVNFYLPCVEPGDLFIWLNRENLSKEDAQGILHNAQKRGAVAAVVPTGIVSDGQLPLLVVIDPLKALQDMALAASLKFDGQRVLVTGSHGKTGFKTQLYHLIHHQKPTHAHLDSNNREAPIFKTLAAIPRQAQIAIVEVAVPYRNIGQDRALLIRPDFCVITGIATEHMSSHKTLDNLILNKAGVVSGLKPGGKCILNADDPHYPALLTAVRQYSSCPVLTFGSASGCEGRLLSANFQDMYWLVHANILGVEIEYRLPLMEDYAPLASVSVLLMASLLGADLPRCAGEYSTYNNYESSGNLYKVNLKDGHFHVYDQTRRGELKGFESMFELMARLPKSGRKIAVISEFINHEDNPGEWVDIAKMRALMDRAQIERLYTVREFRQYAQAIPKSVQWHKHGETCAEIMDELLAEIRAGDIIFLRGVLKAGLDQAVKQLLAMGVGSPSHCKIY